MTILGVEGADLYYELHGEGPPLVLIHGASGTHLSWWQQVAELRYRYSCLIYDLRGYGRSRPTGTYDPGDGHAQAQAFPKGVPPVRSPGELERFAVAYHPYGPVGAAMHLDFPALTFLYAEIMASAGGPPTPATFPVFSTRPVTAKEAATLKFPVPG